MNRHNVGLSIPSVIHSTQNVAHASKNRTDLWPKCGHTNHNQWVFLETVLCALELFVVRSLQSSPPTTPITRMTKKSHLAKAQWKAHMI